MWAERALRLRRDEQGFAVMASMLITSILMVFTISMLATGVHLTQASVRDRSWNAALQVAEAGVDLAVYELGVDATYTGTGSSEGTGNRTSGHRLSWLPYFLTEALRLVHELVSHVSHFLSTHVHTAQERDELLTVHPESHGDNHDEQKRSNEAGAGSEDSTVEGDSDEQEHRGNQILHDVGNDLLKPAKHDLLSSTWMHSEEEEYRSEGHHDDCNDVVH